jgi:NADH/F420H2 dehydrogenase subunit C
METCFIIPKSYKLSVLKERHVKKIYSSICATVPVREVHCYDTGETLLIVSSDRISDVLLFLKNHSLCQFKILTCISGVDNPNSTNRFSIVYDLLSVRYNTRLKVKTLLDDLGGAISVTAVYPSAEWFESEIWDMFGIFFKSHPHLKRILTDYGFNGYPLRKDFPLSGFIEMRYSETQKRVVSESVELSQEYRSFNFSSPWGN